MEDVLILFLVQPFRGEAADYSLLNGSRMAQRRLRKLYLGDVLTDWCRR